VASGVGQFAAIQAVAPSLQVELSPIDARDAREIERAVAAFATRPKAPREAAMAAFAKKLAAGISGAGQAEQATRQRWPPPAPRLRRLLRCHPAGWQSGRGGLSTGATVGRGDRGEAATTAISIARASFS
jgi:hypothetical protein